MRSGRIVLAIGYALVVGALLGGQQAAAQAASDEPMLPSRAKPEECYARVTTLTRTVLAEPAHEIRTWIPAEYATITKTVKVSDERIAWQSVQCETNAPSAMPKAVVAPPAIRQHEIQAPRALGDDKRP